MKIFVFIATAALLFACNKKTIKKNEMARADQATVLNIRGEVMRQRSTSLRWEVLTQATPLFYGDLLSLNENSAARVFYEGRMRAVIDIKGPTLFRVTRQPPSASAFKTLNLGLKSDKTENTVTQDSGVMSKIETKPINFLWPMGPLTLVSQKFPVQTSVAAALPVQNARLILSVYDLSGAKAEVWSAASMTGKFRKIRIPKAGLYRIIVRSDDGRYLNESLTIDAKSKLGDSLSELNNRVVELM